MWLRASILVSLVATSATALAVPVDRVRALLYRADGEARVARLHPDAAIENAASAARFARQAAGRVGGDPALRPGAQALERAADHLNRAARAREDADVRAAAIELALRVRQLDEALPAPPPAK